MFSLRKLFFENDAIKGIRTPLDYLYIRIIAINLFTLNTWPYKELGFKETRVVSLIIRYFHLIIIFVAWIGCISYIVVHNNSMTFFEKGQNYITVLMNALMAIRVTTLTFSKRYREITRHYCMEFHLFFYKSRTEYAMKIHKRVHLICHLMTMNLTIQMFVGCTLFNVIPMYNNYSMGLYSKEGRQSNATFDHSLFYLHPFDYTSADATNGYIAAFIIHWFLSYFCSTWIVMVDLLLFMMVFNLWGHLKLLIQTLYDFPRPAAIQNLNLEENPEAAVETKLFTKSELEATSKLLKECIDHHREITNFTDTMSDVFGPTLFIYAVFHQASGCLLLLECSQMTAAALLRFLPLTITLFQQLIQLSIIFELIGSTSEKLKDAVYSVPWEYMDTSNRRVVFIFLLKVQEPIAVKALGLASVGVQSMAAILKTSLSYFIFLRSTTTT